jgi:uncharacterized protein YndB with AHSA1/START domain
MSARAGDTAAASVYVAVSAADAFEVFTTEIDAWWRHGPRFRIGGVKPGRLVFEQRLGGKLFEVVELAQGERSFETGSVVVWEPPRRLMLEWRGVNLKPHEKTLVDVTFTPLGEGTLVRVEHRGWSELPDGHPVRHGLVGADFARMIGMWWGALLTSLREHIAADRPRG